MTERKPQKRRSQKIVTTVTEDLISQNIKHSLFGYSPLSDCIFQNGDENHSKAVSIFERETSIVLNFDIRKFGIFRTLRPESQKTFILKTLLFIGTPPNGHGIAVLARLLEVLTVHPELTLEQVIEDFAVNHSATIDAVERVIDKYFNVYDNYFYERVAYLTKSQPMTAKDVLCDLSVFIRMKYSDEESLR